MKSFCNQAKTNTTPKHQASVESREMNKTQKRKPSYDKSKTSESLIHVKCK